MEFSELECNIPVRRRRHEPSPSGTSHQISGQIAMSVEIRLSNLRKAGKLPAFVEACMKMEVL